jgi:hypothetical protein
LEQPKEKQAKERRIAKVAAAAGETLALPFFPNQIAS